MWISQNQFYRIVVLYNVLQVTKLARKLLYYNKILHDRDKNVWAVNVELAFHIRCAYC